MSVVVPCFNAAQTLERTLGSIARQEYRNLEILIVDDGSTDATAEVAARFCANEPRARLLRKPNGGVASARNHALAQASGAFVAPIDADDLWHPAKIGRQVAAALQAADLPGFVNAWFRDIGPDDCVWRDGPPLRVSGPALQRLAYFNFVGNGSGPLFSRAALLAVGGWSEKLRQAGAEGCEDLLIQLAVAQHHDVVTVPEYLVGYRLTSGAMSEDGERMLRSWRGALDLLIGAPSMSRGSLRRSEGARLLLLAEKDAFGGRMVPAVRRLSRAMQLDPVRTGLHLLWRAERRFARRIFAAVVEPRAFEDHDPAQPSALTDRWLRRLVRFDQRRLDRLTRLERKALSIRAGAAFEKS